MRVRTANVRHDVRVVDALLVHERPEIRRAQQLEAPAEARELGVLAEGVEMELVRTAHHHAIERDVLLGERDLAGLDRQLEILEGVERALQEIAELEDAARRVDELALRLVERHRLERRRKRAERSVHRDLAFGGVDAHLRADGDRADAIALRDEEALHLHVLQHFGVRAVVRGEQRLEHALALVRELAPQDPIAEPFARCAPVLFLREPLEERPSLTHRNEEEGMVSDLDEKLRVDLVVG
jgi:hypothetical protein